MAYTQVGAGQRIQWHSRLARRLEAAYAARAGEIAAELAVHFEHGRDVPRAVQYWHQAGMNALQRHAPQEAQQALRHALELLATLPETLVRAQQELDVQIAMGSALIAIMGYAAPEVERTYARARVLCAQIGDTPQLFPALQGLCGFYEGQGALRTARELAEQFYRLAQHETVPTHLLEAYEVLGDTLFYLGDYAAARTHLEQGIAVTDPAAQRAQVLRAGYTPALWCLALSALTLWCLGYPAQALRRSQEALTLAQELAHPQSLAVARHFAASMHYRRREAPAVQAQAEALLALATAQGFPLWVGYGTFWRGCGSTRGSVPRRARCWQRSMAGSRKGLTRQISGRLERCWKTWGHRGSRQNR